MNNIFYDNINQLSKLFPSPRPEVNNDRSLNSNPPLPPPSG